MKLEYFELFIFGLLGILMAIKDTDSSGTFGRILTGVLIGKAIFKILYMKEAEHE